MSIKFSVSMILYKIKCRSLDAVNAGVKQSYLVQCSVLPQTRTFVLRRDKRGNSQTPHTGFQAGGMLKHFYFSRSLCHVQYAGRWPAVERLNRWNVLLPYLQ